MSGIIDYIESAPWWWQTHFGVFVLLCLFWIVQLLWWCLSYIWVRRRNIYQSLKFCLRRQRAPSKVDASILRLHSMSSANLLDEEAKQPQHRDSSVSFKCFTGSHITSFIVYFGSLELILNSEKKPQLIITTAEILHAYYFGGAGSNDNRSSAVLEETSTEMIELVGMINCDDIIKWIHATVVEEKEDLQKHLIEYLLETFSLKEKKNFFPILLSNINTFVESFGADNTVLAIKELKQHFPSIAIFTEGDIAIFDRIRNYINGVMLLKAFFMPKGDLIQRSGQNRKLFNTYLKTLAAEVALRNNFVVFNVEVLEKKMSPSLLRYHHSLTQKYSFLKWVTYTNDFTQKIAWQAEPHFDYVEDGVFGIFEHPVITSLFRFARSTPLHLSSNSQQTRTVEVSVMEMDAKVEILRCLHLTSEEIRVMNIPFFKPDSEEYAKSITYHLVQSLPEPKTRPILSALTAEETMDNVHEDDECNLLFAYDTYHLYNEPSKKLEIKSAASQYYFGCGLLPRTKIHEEARIIGNLVRLRNKQLLLNGVHSTTTGQKGTSPIISSGFIQEQVKTLLDSLLQRHTRAMDYLMTISEVNQITEGLAALEEEMKTGTVQVWICKKLSLLCRVNHLPPPVLLGIAQERDLDGVFHVYLSSDHPNPIEGLVYCYFRGALGTDKHAASIMESTYSAQFDQQGMEGQCYVPYPLRYKYQLEHSSISELLIYIMNTQIKKENIRNSSYLSASQKAYFSVICSFIKDYAQYILLERGKDTSRNRSSANTGFIPTDQFESDMCSFIGKATISKECCNTVIDFSKKLHRAMQECGNDNRISDACKKGLWYLFQVLEKAFQYTCWQDLYLQLQTKNSCYLNEPDQVAVNIDMLVPSQNIFLLFQLSTMELGQCIFPKLRDLVPNEIRGPRSSDVPKDTLLMGPDSITVARRLATNFVILHPILLDLLLVYSTDSGLFYSYIFDDDAQRILGIIYIVIFPVLGGMMNSMGRTCNYYFFQRSFPLMNSAFFKRYSGGHIIITILSLALGILGQIMTSNTIYGILSFFYTFFLCSYLLLFSNMIAFRDEEERFYESYGPRIMFFPIFLQLIPYFMCVLLLPKWTTLSTTTVTIIGWSLYIASFIASILWLLWQYKKLSQDFMSWPKSISVTESSEIYRFYDKVVPMPQQQLPGELLFEREKRINLWKRGARDYFAERVERTLTKRNLFLNEEEGIIANRADQVKEEMLLMRWFSERNNVDLPVRYSTEWDIMLSQACTDLKRKFQVEKMNRGDLLFQFEYPGMVFGFLFFMFIFIDRWVLLLTLGPSQHLLFLTDGQQNYYTIGIALGTIFMLFSSEFLENIILHINMEEKVIANNRLGVIALDKMLQLEIKNRRRIYFEQWKVLIKMITAFLCPISGYILFRFDMNSEITFAFGSAVVGFAGLIIGLFHSFFSRIRESTLNVILLFAILVSLVTSITLYFFTYDIQSAMVSVLSGGLFFGLACIFFHIKESTELSKYNVSIQYPASTVGQKKINAADLAKDEVTMQEQIEQIKALRLKQYEILPESNLGMLISSLIHSWKQHYNHRLSLGEEILTHKCLSTDIQIFDDVLSKFKNRTLRIFRIPTHFFEIADKFSYYALSTAGAGPGTLHVFVPTFAQFSEDRQAGIIAESLLHEYIEAITGSHSKACIAEWYLSIRDENSPLPLRMTHQIQTSNEDQLRSLIENTDHSIISKLLNPLDLNKHWESIGNESRSFLVWIILNWKDMVAQENINKKKLLNEAVSRFPPELAHFIRLRSQFFSGIEEVIFESVLISKMAQSLKNAAKIIVLEKELMKMHVLETTYSDYKSKGDVHVNKMLKTIQKPNRLGLLLVDRMRLLYLALINDQRFGRELASLSLWKPTRWILSILYRLSRCLTLYFLKSFQYRTNEDIVSLIQRSSSGLSRIHTFIKLRPRHIICLDSELGVITGFSDFSEEPLEKMDTFSIKYYRGLLPESYKPQSQEFPLMIATHGRAPPFRLYHQSFFNFKGKPIRSCRFIYQDKESRFPSKRCIYYCDVSGWDEMMLTKNVDEVHYFDLEKGNVTGAMLSRKIKDRVVNIQANYDKQHSKMTPEERLFLRDVEFICHEENWVMNVWYVMPSCPSESIFPYVDCIFYKKDQLQYEISYDYSHPQHIRVKTYLIDGDKPKKEVALPASIAGDPYKLLKGRPPISLTASDPLLTTDLKCKRSYFQKWFKSQVTSSYFSSPPTTFKKRIDLWTLWRSGKIAGELARELDENFLRAEPLLQEYWSCRDKGLSSKCEQLLLESKSVFDHLLYVPDTPSSRSHLCFRYRDLCVLGAGGDCHQRYARDYRESSQVLHVINLDSGSWPMGGGSVGASRRYLIDCLNTIRWTTIAEITTSDMIHNEYQIEKNLLGIMYIPLLDLDFGTPNETVLGNIPFPLLEERYYMTTQRTIRTTFCSLLRLFIVGCITPPQQSSHIPLFSSLFVNMYLYFQKYDWAYTWNHPITQRLWLTQWLEVMNAQYQQGVLREIEMPTVQDISILLHLFSRLLLPLSVPLPKAYVVHSSHHGIQSILGVVSKSILGSTFIIWDHGSLWRERLIAIGDEVNMSLFVQTAFIGLTRLVATVAYFEADFVVPCTRIQSSEWESWLGGKKWQESSYETATQRKICAVMNGMDVNKLVPKFEMEYKHPLAVMFSHITRMKGISCAIKAADVIVNKWGMKWYHLHIYGSLEKDPVYANECSRLILSLNLRDHVELKGIGNPSTKLSTGWVFVNASLSEGLPLTIAEAGLCGLPVVCTDVGGSREVFCHLHPDTTPRTIFGCLVPPDSPERLAKAQLKVLSMCDGLDTLVNPDATSVPMEQFMKHSETMLKRVQSSNVITMRHQLGLLLRDKVVSTFSLEKFWQEHEQILWSGSTPSKEESRLTTVFN